jgi:NADPH2:quinone reductase
MFARARFATADRIEQHRILSRAASMIDAGQLWGTLSEVLGTINATNLDIAHQRLASGRTLGKLALAGWDD